jgi:outer membrane protein assembly factor BamA
MDYEERYTKGTSASVKSDSYILSCGYEFNNLLFNGNYFIKGSYLGLWFDAASPLAEGFWEFQRVSLDVRQFFPFSRTTALAMRFNFASIMGPDAFHQPFYIGGMDSIRGYNYDVFRGENLALAKFEFRFPFIDAIRFAFPIPILLRNLTGALYWDFGAVWDNPEMTVFAHYRGDELHFDAIKSGVGMGVRMNLFNYLKIIFDYASPFDGNSILPLERWRGYLSVGYDF